MFQLNRKTLLALEAVLDVALNARPDPVQARAITTRLHVPQRYLEHIMQALVRGNILRGTRGPHGGYRLARERRRITLGEIIVAIDALDDNVNNKPHSSVGMLILAPLCARLQKTARAELDEVTIADLCAHVENTANTKTQDFII